MAINTVMARSEGQRTAIWALREDITEAERQSGPSAKHDISVPVSKMAEFLEKAKAALASRVPYARPLAFGHVGDGNVHFNVLAPVEDTEAINEIIYDLVVSLNGSISAEHGIGLAKIGLLERHKDATSLLLMRQLRFALDPSSIFNPGKLFAMSENHS